MMNKERERERERTQRETKKKRKERRLVFFLSSSSYLWYLFSLIRAMIESNRGRFMYLHSCCCCCCCCCRRRLSRGSEKKVMTKRLYYYDIKFYIRVVFYSFLVSSRKKRKSGLFLVRVSIFSNSHLAILLRVIVA